MDFTSAVGLERIQRAVTLLIIQNINTAIDAQNTLWTARDATFYAAAGRTNPMFSVEHIASEHVYSGTIPSLINSPAENFPNCSVIAYIANPMSLSDDEMERYSITLAVEFLVRADNEEEVNVRIQRTLEAAHSVLTSYENRQIPEGNGGTPLVTRMGNMPVVTISDVFVRHTNTSPTARDFYQHGSLTYRADKYAGFPS